MVVVQESILAHMKILCQIQPPNSKMGINYNDHRFWVKFNEGIECVRWTGEYKQKTWSRSFISREWQLCLSMVHRHAWEKHRLLAGNNSGQVPGDVPSDIVESLAPIIARMPKPKPKSKA